MNDVWEKYKQKQAENNKMIEEMNITLHEGHVRALELCSNCFKYLGRKKIRENLLWSFKNRKEWIEQLVKEEVKEDGKKEQ